MTPLAAWHSMASSHLALPSAFLRRVLSDRTIDDLLVVWIPVQFFAAPVGLGRHDAHQRMREAMIDSGVRLGARLHRLKPVHQMNYVVIVRAKRVRRRRPRNMHYLLTIFRGSHNGEFCVDRA